MEYNFVSDLSEDYTCQICMKLLNEPQLTDCCGQHFCHTCLDQWFQRQGKKQCPHCRSENFNHILYLPLKRKINELKVYCSNREKGCGLTLKLEELARHLSTDNPDGCGYVEIECPNKCYHPAHDIFNSWIYQSILRKDMEDHCKNKCPKRKVRCKYCNEVGAYSYIADSWHGHVQQCQEYPVDCPNKCGAEGLKRKDSDEHREVCPLQRVECPFCEAGCKEKFARKDLDAHIQSSNQQHLLYVMTSLAEVKKYNEHLKSTMAKVASQLEVIQKTVKDKSVATSIDKVKTTLNQASLQLTKEGDQLVFRIPCDSWNWVSPTFTVHGTKMYLKTNPPKGILNGDYYGTLSLILVSGNLDGQYMIDIVAKCEEQIKYSQGFMHPPPLPIPLSAKFYGPTITLCSKCLIPPKHKGVEQQIGRVSLPNHFQGMTYKTCIVTLTLKRESHKCLLQLRTFSKML